MSFFSGLLNAAQKVVGVIGAVSSVVNAVKGFTSTISSISRGNATNNTTVRPPPSVRQPTPAPPPPPDPGVRIQLNPSTESAVPVVYGKAVVGGKIIDARLSSNNLNLYVAMVLCLKTGNKINSDPSEIGITRVFMDDQEILFKPDEVLGIGFLADRLRDAEGRSDTRVRDRIAMNFYNDGSASSVAPGTLELNSEITSTQRDARNLFPNWTTNHFMTNMVFVTVQITYTPSAGLDRLPEFRFEVDNDLTEPGDVLFDYLTNPVYGGGLDAGVVFAQ